MVLLPDSILPRRHTATLGSGFFPDVYSCPSYIQFYFRFHFWLHFIRLTTFRSPALFG